MKTIKIVLVGAGDRADSYSKLALVKPEKMQIVGLVEPDPVRNKLMQEKYHVPKENCFSDLATFLRRDVFADAIINGTMDQLHVETSIPVLEKGYHLLLEKPFCTNEEQLWKLQKTAVKSGRTVMVCHVLRYTPFYSSIKKHVLSGEIGDIVNIELSEHVSHVHLGVSYLRGKWANESVCGSPILLAKSCHDIDLMMWFKDGVKPVEVSSFGSDYQFRPNMKPEGAGHYCMVDCPECVEKQCMYSARKNYLEPRLHWMNYVGKSLEGGEINYDTVKESLQNTENPYSRCVWDCEHDILDHQNVIVNFEDGTTGTFSLVGGAIKGERNIHIVGTKGEIKGVFEDSKYVVRTVDETGAVQQREIDLNVTGDMSGEYGGHGGGDIRLIEDFVDYLRGEPKSISCTELENSIYSHLTVFRAEKARKEKKIEKIFD